MAKKMKQITWISIFLTIVCFVLYRNMKNEQSLGLLITFGTISYHFVMRLLTGWMIDRLLNNRVDYHKKWFQVSDIEQKVYKKLKVKKWKGKMGAYDPDCFDNKLHTWDEIAQAMCQAELVHEVIIVLSFVPVLAAIPFGALPVFVITSVLAACFDGMFVMMQRYNRPRIMKLMERANRL